MSLLHASLVNERIFGKRIRLPNRDLDLLTPHQMRWYVLERILFLVILLSSWHKKSCNWGVTNTFPRHPWW